MTRIFVLMQKDVVQAWEIKADGPAYEVLVFVSGSDCPVCEVGPTVMFVYQF